MLNKKVIALLLLSLTMSFGVCADDMGAIGQVYPILEMAAKAAWDKEKNAATITTVANWLAEQTSPVCQNLSHLLYSYTKDGMYADCFEGRCSIELDNPFVVLELQELKSKKDFQQIVLLLLMYQISEAMYLGDRSLPKSCIIDEAPDRKL